MATKTITDPDMINRIVSTLSEDVAVPVVEDVQATSLPDTHVTLPGGYLKFNGDLVTTAEVKELNGIDEEVISKANTPGQLLTSILRRGTVRIGDEPVTPDMLDNLLSGDRDALLLAIRMATFGEVLDLRMICPSCQETQEIQVDLSKDVHVQRLVDQSDREFTIKCKAGNVTALLPLGVTQRKILDAGDRSGAELNTIFLHGCVTEINGVPVISADDVRRLSVRDREKITSEIASRVPGPKLGEVKKNCPSCEEEMTIPLSMIALFRF